MGNPFDTSGAVQTPPTPGLVWGVTRWSDLSPFTQGYVEAMLSGPVMGRFAPLNRQFGFSDLSPEALAATIRDCEAMCEWDRLARTRFPKSGAIRWGERQRGLDAPRFPPLTPYLGDDGKVYLREAA